MLASRSVPDNKTLDGQFQGIGARAGGSVTEPRTISWSVGIDFDPDVLHGDQPPASGTGPKVLREYHREPAR